MRVSSFLLIIRFNFEERKKCQEEMCRNNSACEYRIDSTHKQRKSNNADDKEENEKQRVREYKSVRKRNKAAKHKTERIS